MSTADHFGFGRFHAGGLGTFAGVVVDDDVVPLADAVPGAAALADLFADWDAHVDGLRGLARRAREGALPGTRRLADLIVLPPVTPGQVFQSGANYRKHVVDLMVAARRRGGEDGQTEDEVREQAAQMMDARAANDQPYVFLGLASSICGPYDDVVLPPTGTQHDWELELAAVIGRRAYQVGRADALGHVAGYTVVNDITTRDRVFRPDIPGIGTDWLAGKNAPTFLPTGPWVVPAAFVPDPMQLTITLRLNGDVMQDESTSDMIFDVARLVEHVSSITPLLPGDLLLTGSPAGNGAHYGRFLAAGDVMDATVTGLGAQRNTCVAAAAR